MTEDDIYLKLENEHIELLKEKIKLQQFADKFESVCNNYIDGKTDGDVYEITEVLSEYHEYKQSLQD